MEMRSYYLLCPGQWQWYVRHYYNTKVILIPTKSISGIAQTALLRKRLETPLLK